MSAVPQPVGRPQGGMKSELGKAAYWRMNYESAIQALADLIAENTEKTEALRELVQLKDGPRDDAYRAAKESAWNKARAALGGEA